METNQTVSEKIKLSVCIICKNEETKIEACLKSVQWADEIIVLDSGSTDSTLKIASRYTDKIFIREDWKGYGIQHLRTEELASNDWLFTIDADEIVTDELSSEIQAALQHAKPEQVFIINRLTHFCGRFIYHSGWYPDPIVRIYNRTCYHFNKKLVHESLHCKGAEKVPLKGHLLHYTFDNLINYINKRNCYANAWAEDKYEAGKKTSALKAIGSSLFAFIRHYFIRRGFLDGKIGLLISVIQMQYTFNKYMMLLLKHQLEADKQK